MRFRSCSVAWQPLPNTKPGIVTELTKAALRTRPGLSFCNASGSSETGIQNRSCCRSSGPPHGSGTLKLARLRPREISRVWSSATIWCLLAKRLAITARLTGQTTQDTLSTLKAEALLFQRPRHFGTSPFRSQQFSQALLDSNFPVGCQRPIPCFLPTPVGEHLSGRGLKGVTAFDCTTLVFPPLSSCYAPSDMVFWPSP